MSRDLYIKGCMDYCLPDLSQRIDWEKPVTSLDKEFQVIIKGSEIGKRLLR